jgi:propionyl-CoA carboxylase alpha chain
MNGHRYAPSPNYQVIDAQGATAAAVEELSDTRFVVRSGDRMLQIDFDPRWRLGEIVLQVRIGDAPMTVQLEREGILYVLRHHGAELRARVLPAHIASLWPLMPVKSPPDMSKFLLSPMPGLLREVAVAEGQEVKAGEKLAVIEAMKMENILRAEQDGKVKKIVAKPGASLAVDEVILEFE